MLDIYTRVANGATIGELSNSPDIVPFAQAMTTVASFCGLV